MKKGILALGIILSATSLTFGQHVDVTPGVGNGLRLWSSDNFKIHMGTGFEYNYGPVQGGYIIKTNMPATNGWGFSWGTEGLTPVAALSSVTGNMQIKGNFVAEGNIGAGGILTPARPLDVLGTIRSTSAGNLNFMEFASPQGDHFRISNPIDEDYLVFGYTSSLAQQYNNLYLFEDGNVGIQTAKNGGYALSVGGSLRAEEIEVSLASTWPDYVFAKDYELKSLEKVEEYIKENNHLPNIPSAKEVDEVGLNLGEMQVKMMEKIEELTLYVIELKKENDKQQRTINKILKK